MSCLSSELLLHLNTQQQGVYHSGEAECLSICNLAQAQADNGNYTMALNLIAYAKKQFPTNTQHSAIWYVCLGNILTLRPWEAPRDAIHFPLYKAYE